MKKGGSAKGELVLAMYELANCFRNGWGIKKDPVAAKQYYETAANLGDTDAMNEVAWCYLEGFGTKKDKVSQFSLFTCLCAPGRACVVLTGWPEWICNKSVAGRIEYTTSTITRSISETEPALLSLIFWAALRRYVADDVMQTPRSSKRRSSYAWPSPREARR